MKCHRCMLIGFIATAEKKAKKWEDTPAIHKTRLKRVAELQSELILFETCTCGQPRDRKQIRQGPP